MMDLWKIGIKPVNKILNFVNSMKYINDNWEKKDFVYRISCDNYKNVLHWAYGDDGKKYNLFS